MGTPKQNHNLGTAENPDHKVDPSSLALEAMRLSVASLLPKANLADSAPKELIIGDLRAVPITDILIDSRFRKDLGDIPMLAASIVEVGLLQPIITTPDLHLVSGMRRLEAHKHLGRDMIVARVMDIEDPTLASVEEDVARKPLTSSEKYAITESLRAKMVDEAWKRRALGGRLEAADKKGRADDLLAKHVGISRPTLAKIRQIVEAAKRDPSRFGEISENLDKDGRVDRHFKALAAEMANDSPTPKFQAIVFDPSWDQVNASLLRKAIQNLQIKSFCTDQTFCLLPTSISNLPRASQLLSQTKLSWQSAVEGSGVQNEEVWLIGTSGKTLPEQFDSEGASKACSGGTAEVVKEVNRQVAGSSLRVNFLDLCGNEAAA